MSQNDHLLSALKREGSLAFAANEGPAAAIESQLAQLKTTAVDGVTCLHEGDRPSVENTRIRITPTGHTAFYTAQGKRFLTTDPGGHPLNESEWKLDEQSGQWKLQHVRLQLDNLQWIGIRPRDKTFATEIDIKGQPGWETISLDSLREKAAEAWRVPFSEVKYFYTDENMVHSGDGKYDVRLIKDGLYALIDGSFEKTMFISFMFSVNWEKLDLIPVVELFQSTLPGSGGACFEYIWGLHDDQSREVQLEPLRYRGLPTYPSKEAFNIFSAFFIPKGPGNEDIMKVFMNTDRSHEITWTPRPNPPWRYFSSEQGLTLTVQDRHLYKVTEWNNPVPIPFTNCALGGKPSCQREVQVGVNSFHLVDETRRREIPFSPEWKIKPVTTPPKLQQPPAFNWKWFFNGLPPKVDPVKAIYTVPFYPAGASEIDESSLQPMVLDQMFYYMEMSPGIPAKLEKIDRVLIHTLDTVIAGCIDCTRERQYTVLYSDPEFAQKNACLLWNYAAARKQLDNLKKVSFLAEGEHVAEVYKEKYGLIFKWLPFMYHQDREACESMLKSLSEALEIDGLLFLAAPRPIQGLFNHYSLDCRYNDPVINMPFYRQHLKMCPGNLVNPDFTVFLLEKMAQPKKEETPPQVPSSQVEIPMAPLRDYSRED